MADSGGKTKSFAECMMGILAELGRAEAYPDADPAVVQGVRELVLPAVQNQMASQDPMAMMSAMGGGAPPGGDPSMGAMPPDPTQMAQAPTRLPRKLSDPSQMASALERELSGIPANQ